MTRLIIWFTCMVLMLVSTLSVGHAADDKKALGMVTGPLTGTYIRFGNDIAKVAGESHVPVTVKESKGSVDNIRRISSTENAALGIVQSDVLGYLKRTRNPESMRVAQNLRMIFPFYKEEVHLIANKSVQTFSDLNGKRVVVGNEGSGSWLTSMNLLTMTQVKPAQMLRLSPAEGLMSVLKGQADAMIFVGGRPVKLFKNLEDLSRADSDAYRNLLQNVHFVPLDDLVMLSEYTASKITPKDYSFVDYEVPTVAVTAVLVSYKFGEYNDNPYARMRCEQLGTVANAIRTNIKNLQERGHAKWREVDLTATPGLWKRDNCVEQSAYMEYVMPANGLERDFLSSIQSRDWE